MIKKQEVLRNRILHSIWKSIDFNSVDNGKLIHRIRLNKHLRTFPLSGASIDLLIKIKCDNKSSYRSYRAFIAMNQKHCVVAFIGIVIQFSMRPFSMNISFKYLH